SGMTIKLAVNSLFAIQVSAWGEISNLLSQSGIDQAHCLEILTATPICSPAATIAVKSMLSSNFAPLFPIELVNKDLTYAMKNLSSDQAELSLIGAAQKIYAKAIEQGYGDDNITGIVQLYQ
ncbi:MAG: NAD-binding protein, partial [Cyanobacteria bacterium P01_A01_bin.83]